MSGQQLRLVDALDLLDTLQLKDQCVFHKDIDAVATVQADALVFDWLWVLKQEGDPVELQFVRQALLIRGFEQAKKFGDVSNFLTFCFELRARSFAQFKVQDAFGVFKAAQRGSRPLRGVQSACGAFKVQGSKAAQRRSRLRNR